MNKKTIITILFALVAMAGQGQDTILWERPAIGYSDISYFEVQKVELTKERTAMHVCVSLMPGYKFHIKKESFLQTNGKQYEIIGSDGLTLDGNYITMADTGMMNFVLYFKPMPMDTKEFDFIEGMAGNDYRVYSIHDKDYVMPITPVPAEYLADNAEEEQPIEQKYSEGHVTIYFKALNYRKGMRTKITLQYIDLKNPTRPTDTKIRLNDDGEAEVILPISIPQHVSAEITNVHTVSSCNLFLVPGKEATLILDMLYNDTEGNGKFVGYKGCSAKLFWEYRPAMRNFLKGTEYNWQKMSECKDVTSLINFMKGRKSYREEWKRTASYSEIVKAEILTYFNMPLIFTDSVLDSLKQTDAFTDYVIRNHSKVVLSSMRYFDYDFVYTSRFYALDKDARGFNADLARYCYYLPKVLDGQDVTKPLIEDPTLSALYDKYAAEYRKTVAANKEGLPDNAHYLDMTDIVPDSILQTILDKYKGKTILIDIWATWCGPCKLGHEKIKPLKEELSDKDIVYVYLTSTTSKYDEWKKYITDISGEHYYLTQEQMNTVFKQLQADGYPTYAIYTSNGNKVTSFSGFRSIEDIREAFGKVFNNK